MRLDETDWALIRELYGWDAGNFPTGPLRVSMPKLAKRTGLHPKTVKARVRALRKGGVIEGPYFQPRPQVAGLHMSGLGIEGVHVRDAAWLEGKLAATPEVETVVYGRDYVYVIAWHEEAAYPPPVADRLMTALGGKDSWKSFSTVDFPPAPAPTLTPLDWRLAFELRRLPGRSLAAVAKSLGLTARTVERRARRLIEGGAGAMQTRFRPGRIEGALYVQYVVREGDGRAAASLAKAFPDRIVGPFGPTYRANVGVATSSLDEAERRRMEAETLPGLTKVDLLLIRDWIYPAAFEAWLRAAVAKGASGVPSV